MNEFTPASAAEMLGDLRAFAAVGQEALALAVREHQSLADAENHESFSFYHSRKDLLNRLKPLALCLKRWRSLWRQLDPHERLKYSDIKLAIQMIQDLIIKILQLDRENQQALLRRGLVPARHVNSCAVPPPHFVAGLYRRHNPQ